MDVSAVVTAISLATVAVLSVGLARLLIHVVIKGNKEVRTVVSGGYRGGQRIGADTSGNRIYWYDKR